MVGVTVRVLAFGLSGLVQALARDIVLCSWARHLTVTVPLSIQASVIGKVNNAISIDKSKSPSNG